MGARPDALNAAIDEAWRVFDIPAPATTGVCEKCCMYPEIEADFLRRRARDLPIDYVRDWYYAAHHEKIRHAHVAWFLPRVMEMLADGQHVASAGIELTFSRLPLTGFPDRWPERQVEAINHFAQAFLAMKLTDKPPMAVEDLDSLLCMFGEGGIDLGPLLRFVEALADDALVDLLHRTWFVNHAGKISFDAFWSREPARSMAWNWYTSSALMARMERSALAGNEKALEIHDLILTVRSSNGL